MKVGSPNKAPRWHLIYYALAAFDLLTIAGSLMLNHSVLGIYSTSISDNSAWVARTEKYEELAAIASNVNAPGNDVFDSHKVTEERNRLQKELQKFNSTLSEELRFTQSLSNKKHVQELSEKFANVDRSMKGMVAEAELIFSYFQNNEPQKAGSRMASMDQRYADLNKDLRELRSLVRGYQKENLHDQEAEAKSLSKFEWLIGGIILIIVSIVTVYGHWLSKKINETNETLHKQRASLETSARLSALGTMSAGIAHEINNPLAIIQGNAERIRNNILSSTPDNQKIAGGADKIILTTKRISTIIKGLRDFSRDGSNDVFVSVNLKAFIDESLSFCQERFKNNGIELRVTNIPENFNFDCRQVQIAQVLVNLLNNAFDAVCNLPNPWIEVSTHIAETHLKIFVKDCGSGIPKEIQEKMLTPFFTTKEVGKGTGLGLSISHTVIERHGGKLFVESSCPNTLFVIELPIKQQSQDDFPISKAA